MKVSSGQALLALLLASLFQVVTASERQHQLDVTITFESETGRWIDADSLATQVLEAGLLDEERLSLEFIDVLGQIVRSSSGNPAVQSALLERLQERVGIDVDGAAFARLADDVALARGEQQAFGTYPEIVEGRIDSTDRDYRFLTPRENLGIEPIRDYRIRQQGILDLGLPVEAAIPNQRLSIGSPSYPTLPLLRRELMNMYRLDQSARKRGGSADVDREHLPRIRDIVEEFGFPSELQVGRFGVQAAFLLIQHAVADPDFMSRCLELAGPLMESGDLSRVFYAMLSDRVALAGGGVQLYGTQRGRDENGMFVFPVESVERLNERRASMSLRPFPPDAFKLIRPNMSQQVIRERESARTQARSN